MRLSYIILLYLIWLGMYLYGSYYMGYTDGAFILVHISILYLYVVILGIVYFNCEKVNKKWVLIYFIYCVYTWIDYHVKFSWGIPDALYDLDLLEQFNRGFPFKWLGT